MRATAAAMVRVATIAGVAYAGIVLYIHFTQAALIFLPDTPTRSVDRTPALLDLDYEEVWLTTSDGLGIHGWFIPAERADAPAVAFFHGNAGNIGHRLDTIALLHGLDVATLIIDYRGYGRSAGQPGEEGLYRDAEAAWDWLAERGYGERQIIAFGRSLGGAVAAELALRRPLAAVITDSTFSSMVDMGREIYPWLPVNLLLRHRFDTRDKLERIDVPTLVLHSRDDDLVSFDHARRLAAVRPPVVKLVELSGGHNQPASGRTGYADELRAFIGEYAAGP